MARATDSQRLLFQRFLDIESFQLFDGSMARVSFPSLKGKSYYVRRNSFSGKVEEDPLLSLGR